MSEPCRQFDALLARPGPVLALAPMQDVTDLPFWRLMTEYGGADLYYTEYFRVHRDSHLEKWILESLTRNPTGRPAIAQMIGNDVPSLVRAARELQQYPVAGDRPEPGLPGARGVPEVRGRRVAAGAGEDRRDPRRAAGCGDGAVHGEDAARV